MKQVKLSNHQAKTRQILNLYLHLFNYVAAYSSGEKFEAAEMTRRVIIRKVGGVHGLRQDQEQTVDGKEEEVKEQQGPQKQEVGEHSRPKPCAQPL